MKRLSKAPAIELAVAGLALGFVVSISLFPITSNDIWWQMAVGREMLRTGHFITRDIFTFTVPGSPWVPHSWLADLLFYIVNRAFTPVGLIGLRVVLVTLIFLLVYRILWRRGISLIWATPVVLVAVLVSQTRFLIRPHLFEYLFIVLLLGHLLDGRERRGVRFYVFPVALQVLWVNVHASFYLGPILVGVFYVGEWLSKILSKRIGAIQRLTAEPIAWNRVVILLGLMLGASFVNPSPLAYVFQPLDAGHRELLTRFTAEWKSPFDPALGQAAFRPYYEILVAFAVAAFILGMKRLRPTSLLLVGLSFYLSLTAHRFRVEFAILAVPLALDQLKAAPITDFLRRWLAKRKHVLNAIQYLSVGVLSAVLVYGARDRITIEGVVALRYPTAAFDIIRDADVARRPYHTIGYGSYLLWHLFPERSSFIDGRNFDPQLYRDFLVCQANLQGFQRVADKYQLDAFIIPMPELCDAGMLNVHRFLMRTSGWALAHIDGTAFVYVRNDAVPEDWLESSAYRLYHPMTFGSRPFATEQLDTLITEISRAAAADSTYIHPLGALALVYEVVGDTTKAIAALERVLPKISDPLPVYERLCHLYGGRSLWQRVLVLARRFEELKPGDYRSPYFEAQAYFGLGRYPLALESARNAQMRNNLNADIHVLLARIYLVMRNYLQARTEAEAALALDRANAEAKALIQYLDGIRR